MRLRSLYGPHRLAMLGVVLLVLSVSVFTLTAAFARVREEETKSSHPASQAGALVASSDAESTTGFRFEGQDGQAVWVATSELSDFRLTYSLTDPTRIAFPEVTFRQAPSGSAYILGCRSDGTLQLIRQANGRQQVVAAAALPAPTQGQAMAMELVARGASVQAKVDGELAIDYRDPDPLPQGNVRVRITDDATRLSDLRISPLAP